MAEITVLGAGLAGCEAAVAAADSGAQVRLIEMKPAKYTPAHHSPHFAELVCSNSLKARRVESAAGLLKEEMRLLGSVCVEAAYTCDVPAGGALAVDRDRFAAAVTERVTTHPRIRVECREATELPAEGVCVVATGPLTSDALATALRRRCGGALSFFDAAAPIVTAESVDMAHAFCASRYDREESGEGDYINCPMDKAQYEAFHAALIEAQSAPLHEFDRAVDEAAGNCQHPEAAVCRPADRSAGKKVYEGCMPIEVLAARGVDAIRYGPMKPVGLRNPRTGHRPWAVLQLRRENAEGSLLNLVGFQTNLTFGEQKRVFGMIPALHEAEFVRYGVMHRNTFLDSPRLLTAGYQFRREPRLFFAGQMTGVEGYMESAASGLLAGHNAARALYGQPPLELPRDTMMGALAARISDPLVSDFQPMGASFGLLPPLSVAIRDKRQRYAALAQRALASLRVCGAMTEKE